MIKRLHKDRMKRGQFKIQQMAFVLVALIIFFGLVALFYFTIQIEQVKKSALNMKEEEAKELVKKISASPEFAFSSNKRECVNCIDIDKVLIIKSKEEYNNFWRLDLLEIEILSPKKTVGECTSGSFPNCNKITIRSEEHTSELQSHVNL